VQLATMSPLFQRIGPRAFDEMRTLTFSGHPVIPDGTYGLLEFYCEKPGCDCRRVVLHVVREDTGLKSWASINFGWEPEAFYVQWMSGNAKAAKGMAGASLDTLNPQTEHAPAFFAVVEDGVLTDADYVARLRRHYAEFKAACSRPAPGSMTSRKQRRQ